MPKLHFNLIEHLSPPSILVTPDDQIAHLSRGAGRFLKFVGGTPTTDLLSVIHPMLRSELRAALFRAREQHTAVLIPNVPVDFGSGPSQVDLAVQGAAEIAPGCLLVTFQE